MLVIEEIPFQWDDILKIQLTVTECEHVDVSVCLFSREE